MGRDVTVGGGVVVAAGLTRGQVAEALGVSISAVRRMEGKLLHPRLVAGTWFFDPEEIVSVQKAAKPSRRVRSSSEGELSAEVFRRFGQGQDIRKIVLDLHQPPDRIRGLFREWAMPLGDEPGPPLPRHFIDETEITDWESTMRAQMASDEEADRQDREQRLGRRPAIRGRARQA